VIDEYPDALAKTTDCQIRFFIRNHGCSSAKLQQIRKEAPLLGVDGADTLDLIPDPWPSPDPWALIPGPFRRPQ
jgi:hypothetical protein